MMFVPFTTNNQNGGMTANALFNIEETGFQLLNRANNGVGSIVSGIDTFIKTNNPDYVLKSEEFSEPYSGAHIGYLESKLNTSAVDFSDTSVAAWTGVLAMLGLSEWLGYDLGVQPVILQDSAIYSVYKPDLEKAGFLDSHFQGGQSGVWKLTKTYTDVSGQQKTADVALLSNKMILCPFNSVDPSAFSDIPWFDSKCGKWNSFIEYLGSVNANGNFINMPTAQRMYLWLETLKKADLPCNNAINALQNAISNRFAGVWDLSGVQLSAEKPEWAIGVGNFMTITNADGNGMSILFDLLVIPKHSVKPLSMNDFFSSCLLITKANTLGDLQTMNAALGNGDMALLPISKAGTDFLTVNRKSVKLASFNIQQESNGYNVAIAVQIDGIQVSYEKTYTVNTAQVIKILNFPLLSLWPNVYPTNNNDECLWKRYYVSISDNAIDLNFTGFTDLKKYSNLSIDNAKVKNSVTSPSGTEFGVASFDVFPEYIHFEYSSNTGTVDIGCICVVPPTATPNYGSSVTAAVDFGTSNTMCVMQINEAASSSLLQVGKQILGRPKDGDLYNPERIRRLYSVEIGGIDCAKDVYDTFLMTDWISDGRDSDSVNVSAQYVTQKIRSIALRNQVDRQLRLPASLPGGGIPAVGIVDGRMFVTDENMRNYVWTNGTFRNHICANMKMSSIFGNAQAQAQAITAELALTDLAIHCALESLMAGASQLQFIYSYPDDNYQTNLRGYWLDAVAEVNRSVDAEALGTQLVSSPADSMEEGEAASRYFIASQPDGLGHFPGNSTIGDFAVIDIGGGTTDITLWRMQPGQNGGNRRAKEIGKLSIPFAGNQIIAESLLGCYKRRTAARMNDFPSLFRIIPGGQTATTRFIRSGTQNAFANYNGGDLDMIYARTNGIVQDIISLNDARRIGNGAATELQVQLQLRISCVFFLLSEMILKAREQCQDFCSATDATSTFHIYFAGGGSQALGLCDQNFLPIMKNKLARSLGIDPETYSTMFYIDLPQNANKTEVVHGMLFGSVPGVDFSTLDAHSQQASPTSTSQLISIDPNVIFPLYTRFVSDWNWLGQINHIDFDRYGFSQFVSNDIQTITNIIPNISTDARVGGLQVPDSMKNAMMTVLLVNYQIKRNSNI